VKGRWNVYLVVEDWHMTGDHLGEDGHDADDDQQLGVGGTGHDEQGRPDQWPKR
jgi:hypothetical protein